MAVSWDVSVSEIDDDGVLTPKYSKTLKARADYDPQGLCIKIVDDDNGGTVCLEFPVQSNTDCCKLGKLSYIFNIDDESFVLKFNNKEDYHSFSLAITKAKSGKGASVFSVRTEDSSATQYFQFYGYLSQQQNMLQDFVRTYTYQRAILSNLDDFKDKVVLDVGAGSGILSFFAAQAGAAKVYAVEASTMAHYAQKLVAANNLQDVITVIPGKIEEIDLPVKVDVIISEPMGYMLYNERMLETYLHAKKWLLPGGKMYPSRGDLHIAPFTDDSLFMEQYGKANFWFQTCFHGVNLSVLQNYAVKEYFRQPIVDTFDIRICMSKSVRHVVDFLDADESDLHTIDIPLEFHLLESGTCHGLAFWFDVSFGGGQQTVWLSTGPTEPLTHWYQVRCLLEQPLLVKQGQVLTGRVLLHANKRQSYDVTIELSVEGTTQRSSNTLDLKNPYFRYTGAPVQPPPGVSNISPSENYWTQLDAQGVRNAVNMVNGMSVNGLGEVSMDTTQSVISNNLITSNLIALVDPSYLSEGTQPNIHPGCISSTGRGRVAASPTSTHTAQLIGGAISPNLFTSPNVQQILQVFGSVNNFVKFVNMKTEVYLENIIMALINSKEEIFGNIQLAEIENSDDVEIKPQPSTSGSLLPITGSDILQASMLDILLAAASIMSKSSTSGISQPSTLGISQPSTSGTSQPNTSCQTDPEVPLKIEEDNGQSSRCTGAIPKHPKPKQQPLVMTNYPVSANLMIGDYVTPGNNVAMPAYRQ